MGGSVVTSANRYSIVALSQPDPAPVSPSCLLMFSLSLWLALSLSPLAFQASRLTNMDKSRLPVSTAGTNPHIPRRFLTEDVRCIILP
jgi:hypothetical protein